MTEPWLSGPIAELDTLLAPLFYSFEQTRQELDERTAGLTADQIWARPHGITPIGFHIRHIGGTADRLTTYMKGQTLAENQLAALKTELEPGASRDDLLNAMRQAMTECEAYVRTIDPATLRDRRGVGRKQLPTTVHGLLVHLCEHTFRHLGQAVTTIKLVKAIDNP
ncbi:MAG: DinB family protein [Bryobacterales bacterium]|nr:DinB family protein [Bryobacterales bacterium]